MLRATLGSPVKEQRADTLGFSDQSCRAEAGVSGRKQTFIDRQAVAPRPWSAGLHSEPSLAYWLCEDSDVARSSGMAGSGDPGG